jgi:predicted DNA-binding protein
MKSPGPTPTFTLRLPAELRAELERRAEADGRSLANYVTRVLAHHVEQTATVALPAPNRPAKKTA